MFKKALLIVALLCNTAYAVRQVEVKNPRGQELRVGSTQTGTWTVLISTDNQQIKVSTLNTTATPIGAGVLFVGEADSLLQFQETTVNLAGAPDIASGTIFFEFSPDAINWDVSIPLTLPGPNSLVPLSLRNVLPFLRVRYQNNGTPLTEFRLTTVLHRTGAKHLTRFLNQDIGDNEPVENVRSFQGAKSPNGPFVNLPASGPHFANSSTNTLAAFEEFEGEFFDSAQFSGAVITIVTDANGTLMIDSSLDGFTLESTEEFSVSSGVPFFIGATPLAQFFKIRYTNGGTPQGKFFLSTIPKVTAINPRFQPLNASLNDSSVAQVVRAVLAGKNVVTGLYEAVGLEGDRLRVVSPPPSAPAGTLPVGEEITGAQSGSTDIVFVIPAGSTITIQRLSGGSEVSNTGGKIELFFDADCSAGGDQFLEVIYANGSSENFELDDDFVGDGTACVRMRRTNLTGGNVDMFARWVGFVTP